MKPYIAVINSLELFGNPYATTSSVTKDAKTASLKLPMRDTSLHPIGILLPRGYRLSKRMSEPYCSVIDKKFNE
jgi:uncharacterized protein (UPF0305 family)